MTESPQVSDANGKTVRAQAPADPAMDDSLTAFFVKAAQIINAADTASGDVMVLGRTGCALRTALDTQITAAQEQAADPALDLATADGYGVKADHLRRLCDRLSAVLGKLRTAHQAALGREEEARRRAAYDAAVQAVQKASDKLPNAERQFRLALQAATDARRLVGEVNAALPTETEPLVVPAAIAEEVVIGTAEEDGWVDARDGTSVILPGTPVQPGRTAATGVVQVNERPVMRRRVRKISYRLCGEAEVHTRYEALPAEPEQEVQAQPQITAAERAVVSAADARARREWAAGKREREAAR